jgi:hypothetical protein
MTLMYSRICYMYMANHMTKSKVDLFQLPICRDNLVQHLAVWNTALSTTKKKYSSARRPVILDEDQRGYILERWSFGTIHPLLLTDMLLGLVDVLWTLETECSFNVGSIYFFEPCWIRYNEFCISNDHLIGWKLKKWIDWLKVMFVLSAIQSIEWVNEDIAGSLCCILKWQNYSVRDSKPVSIG